MNKRTILAVSALLLGACAQVTVETTTLSGGSMAVPSEDPAASRVRETAGRICEEHAWIGIEEPASFGEAAAEIEVEPAVVAAAVRRECPESFYQPLSRSEADWCGEGMSFGRNFFLVVAAGVELGIESFTVVEPALVAKATDRSAELTDYEIELLTAELQTMSESSRFDRDWAQACRSTF